MFNINASLHASILPVEGGSLTKTHNNTVVCLRISIILARQNIEIFLAPDFIATQETRCKRSQLRGKNLMNFWIKSYVGNIWVQFSQIICIPAAKSTERQMKEGGEVWSGIFIFLYLRLNQTLSFHHLSFHLNMFQILKQ